MEALSAWTTVFDQFYIHTTFCVSRPTTAPECGEFWSTWIFGCFALGSLALLLLVWKSTSYSVQFYTARLLPLELERAPADMAANNLQWIVEPAAESESPGDELEDRIRTAFGQIVLAEATMPEDALSKAA
jgi:hypothetical protein